MYVIYRRPFNAIIKSKVLPKVVSLMASAKMHKEIKCMELSGIKLVDFLKMMLKMKIGKRKFHSYKNWKKEKVANDPKTSVLLQMEFL